jgi:hypothetical protein
MLEVPFMLRLMMSGTITRTISASIRTREKRSASLEFVHIRGSRFKICGLVDCVWTLVCREAV